MALRKLLFKETMEPPKKEITDETAMPMTEGRLQTLKECMGATLESARIEIEECLSGRQYPNNDILRKLLQRTDKIYLEVLTGEKKVTHYAEAVNTWKQAACNAIGGR